MADAPYSAVTRGIRVSVRPEFLPDHSDASESRWVWAYHVTIENEGRETVQLLHRTWTITDALGRSQQVHGPGVVGEQPVLGPGERFRYSSGTPLPTSSGFMRGMYHMVVRDSGEMFDVTIPPFSLDSPGERGRLN